MKKQILFLSMFTLALIFAGPNNVFGQVIYKNYIEGALTCPPAVALSCASAVAGAPELNPVAGAPYTYTIAALPNTVSNVLWFVTDDVNVISTLTNQLTATRDVGDGSGSYLASSGPANVYNNTTATPNTALSVNLSWKNFNGTTTPVLLVAYVKGAAGCTDNIEVWRIKPVFNFTLDVLSMKDDGTLGSQAVPASECVSQVESAVYNSGTDKLTMNYGKNFVFFNVTAANFVGSWLPALSATATTGTIGTVQWAYPSEATKNAASLATGIWKPTTSPVVKQNVVANDSVVGPLASAQCIVVRVEVINNAIQDPINAAINAVTLSVDGTMRDPAVAIGGYANATLKDMDEPAAAGACRNDYTDTAIFNITARPDINESNPAPASFVPKN